MTWRSRASRLVLSLALAVSLLTGVVGSAIPAAASPRPAGSTASPARPQLLAVGGSRAGAGFLIPSTPGVHGTAPSSRPAPASAFLTTATTTKPFFGIAVPNADLATIPAITSAAGEKPSVLNIFLKLDSPFTTKKLTDIAAAGMKPYVSLEPWSWKTSGQGANQPAYSLKSIYNGTHDADFKRIAGVIAAAKTPIYLRFAHEMNAWWYPWAEAVNGNKPGEYVKAWNHVHDIFTAAGATDVKWVWSPNVVINNHANTTALSGLVPAGGYFNLAGITCYGHSTTASKTCGPTLTEIAKLTTKHVVLSEVGADGISKAAWISSMNAMFNAYPQVSGFNWFNTNPKATGASGYYEFTDTPPDTMAFRGMLLGR